MEIRIGSRGSALALWQARHVQGRLEEQGHRVSIHVIVTTGDRVKDARLETVGGKGAFLKEIEEALVTREVDLAVHSLKDVPVQLPPGLVLCSCLERADPRDALVSSSGRSLRFLSPGARVGTTSLRRQAQLLACRSDLVLQDLRGNVDTRLQRLSEGRFDAIVLSLAGLARLGREAAVTEILDAEVVLPAPGQGAVVLECREGDPVLEVARGLHHEPTQRLVGAERSFLASLGGGCNTPLAALAEPIEGGQLKLRGLVASRDGTKVLRGQQIGTDPEVLGRALGSELLSRGAGAILGH